MDKKITFEKQALPYESEPNIAVPMVEVINPDVVLTFVTKNSDKIGKIIFRECSMYRVGDPNDEGFYSSSDHPKYNSSIYSHQNFPDLEFGYFYKVTGFDWRNISLGENTIVINDEFKDKENHSHFVFFMKDGTFECVAKSYDIENS